MNHQIDDSIYQKFLKDLRLLGRSKVDVAERLGFHKSNLSNYIKGTVWPGAKTIKKFYEEFGEELERAEKDRKDAPFESFTHADVQNLEQEYRSNALELKKMGKDLQIIKGLLLNVSLALGINPDQTNGEESGK